MEGRIILVTAIGRDEAIKRKVVRNQTSIQMQRNYKIIFFALDHINVNL